jgi:hypothetical protein
VASHSRCEPGRNGVDTDVVDMDVVYADEGTAESVKIKSKGVDDIGDEVVEVFSPDYLYSLTSSRNIFFLSYLLNLTTRQL